MADYQNIGLQTTISSKSLYLLVSGSYNFNRYSPLSGEVGIGKKINLYKNLYYYPEISGIWYFSLNKNTSQLNNIHIKFGIGKRISKNLLLKFSPSIYCSWKDNINSNKEYNQLIHIISPLKPFFSEETGNHSSFDIGTGFSFSITYKIKE
jgi:hypothetical protein